MKTRFFCESCGAEVSRAAKVCPSCGKTFTAIRCPQCAFEGGAKQFARGCPRCGYLNVLPASETASGVLGAATTRRPRPRARAFSLPRLRLPAGFYRTALIVLLALLVALLAALVALVTRR